MAYTYTSLSSNGPGCTSDGEPEEYPMTPDGGQSVPLARKSRNHCTHAVFVVVAQIVYTIIILFAARELYYKSVCPAIAAPDRSRAWVHSTTFLGWDEWYADSE